MLQRDLARAVGVESNHISRYEFDKVIPRLPVARRIAQVLGVTMEELYEWDD